MFDLVTQNRKDQMLTFEDLVIAKVSSKTCHIVSVMEMEIQKFRMQNFFKYSRCVLPFAFSKIQNCFYFCIPQSIYEKGTKVEIEEFIYQLVDVTGDGILDRYSPKLFLSLHLDTSVLYFYVLCTL